MQFDTFVSEISPKNVSDVSTSWNEIRKKITDKSSIISKSLLTGSYVRSTTIDPVVDLDIFFNIDFSDTRIETFSEGIKIYLTSDFQTHQLKEYCVYQNNKYYVSPIRLINHIWKLVQESYTTTNAQSRNGECYTVYLSSKNLTIDCVPHTWVTGQDYKLIPKGENNIYWKKTNPDIDKQKIAERNYVYSWKLKGVIKIMKYWNKNKNTGIKFKSYILECLVYYAFWEKCTKDMTYNQLMKKVVEYIYNNIDEYRNIRDLPKYEYMYYSLDITQRNRIKTKLSELYENLKVWEHTTVKYLKN